MWSGYKVTAMQVRTTAKSNNNQKDTSASATKKNKPFFSAVGVPVVESDIAVSEDSCYEDEADRIANNAMQISAGGKRHAVPAVSVVRSSSAGKNIPPKNNRTGKATNISTQIARSRGEGMDEPTKDFMESRLGARFDDVKIHDDTSAHKAASAIKAKAFTYGTHIFFNKGMYQPDTDKGRHLLAHELAHTLQQGAGFKVIQKKGGESIADDDEFKDLSPKTLELDHIFLLHRKADPSNKKIATLTTNLLNIHKRFPEALWDQAKPVADAAVTPSQQNELDVLFDVYKFLGRHAEAKELSKTKKYIPAKTAFYSADFYKEVLKDDLAWLPGHPALEPFFPFAYVDTFRMFLYGPFFKVQTLIKAEQLKKQRRDLVSQIRRNTELMDNERTLAGIDAFIELNIQREIMMDQLVAHFKNAGDELASKIKIAEVLTADKLIAALGPALSAESAVLLRSVAPLIQAVAEDAIKFWKNTDTTAGYFYASEIAFDSIVSSFKMFAKEFKQYEEPLNSAAITFLQLTPSGNIPGKGQFESNRKAAAKQLHSVVNEASKALIRLQRSKPRGNDKILAGNYGLFIDLLLTAYNYSTDKQLYKSTEEEYLNGQKLYRYGFGQKINYLGILLQSEKLILIAREVLHPEGRTIFGGVQSEIFIAFGDKVMTVLDPLSPQQVLREFAHDLGGKINKSAYLTLFLQAFFRNALIEQEVSLLEKELENRKQANGSLTIEEFTPIEKRVSDITRKVSLTERSVIPIRYNITPLYYTVPKSQTGKLADFIFENKKLSSLFSSDLAPYEIFIPDSNEDKVVQNGIRVWALPSVMLEKFAKTMSRLFPDMVIPNVDSKNFHKAYDGFLDRLLVAEKGLKGKPAKEGSLLYNMLEKSKAQLIEDPKKALLPLRRKAMSADRREIIRLLLRPLWDKFDEKDLSTWNNPKDAIGAMLMLAGDTPLLLDENQQDELKLQITAAMLELGPLIDKRLLKQGTFNAVTSRMDVIVKLLPQVVGAISMEGEVAKNRETLDLEFKPAEQAARVEKLKDLQAGLLEILHAVYESETTQLLNLENGRLLDKVFVGEWLETDTALTELRDRNSNIPFTKKLTFKSEGKTYSLLDIKKNFHYKPAVNLDAGNVAWPKDLIADINPSVLILNNGNVASAIPRKERKGEVLFSYMVLSDNGKTETVDVHDNDDDKLRDMRALIGLNSNIENLKTLNVVLETGAAWITTPFYFIPGFGEAVMAGDIVMGVMQFLTSPEFDILKKILNGDGKEMLEESFDKAKSFFSVDKLWDKLFDEDFELPTFVESKPKTPETEEFDQKSDGKLKKFLLSIIRFGKKLLNGLAGLKSLFNYSLKKIHYFILNRPFLAGALSFVVRHFNQIAAAFKSVGKEDTEQPEEPNVFVGEINLMLNNLTELQVPLNLIPLDVILDFIVRIALKSLRGPKGIIAGSVKSLLEKAGIYSKLLDLVQKQLSNTWIDPNKYINNLINEKLQPIVHRAGTGMAEEFSHVLKEIPGFENVKMPRGPEIDGFKDSGDNYDSEESAEANPFPAANFTVNASPSIPAHPNGGAPLNKRQAREFSRQYGHDFSHVRIHNDAGADAANQQAGAHALTSGSHIFLRSGLSLEDNSGKSILKHELAHVLQQTGPRPVSANHSTAPVDGKPAKGIVYDQQKEDEANRFANGAGYQALSYSSIGNSNTVHPKLTDSARTFFTLITKEPDAKSPIHGSDAPMNETDQSLARSLPGMVIAAIEKMTIIPSLAAGMDIIKQYLQKTNWAAKEQFFEKLVQISKVPKKFGKITANEADWKFKVNHLDLALEEYIAIVTGVVADIELDKTSMSSLNKFNIDNIFLDKVKEDTVFQALVTNTFGTTKSPKLKTKYNPSKDQAYINATKNLVKDRTGVFARTGFKFTDAFAKEIEFVVNAGAGVIHTGTLEDPIEIRWTKTGHPKYIPITRAISAPGTSTNEQARMDGKTRLDLPDTDPGRYKFPYQTEDIGGRKHYYLEIGVNEEFMYKVGKKMKRTASGKRVMERYFTKMLGAHNFVWSGYSPDHVQDLGFGAVSELDVLNNFWPLESKYLNTEFGNKIYNQKVMYKEGDEIIEKTVSATTDKWFIIKSIGTLE